MAVPTSYRLSVVGFALAVLLAGGGPALAQSSFDTAKARAAFSEAQALSQRDGGKLWGVPLYGPMLFVDTENGMMAANVPDAGGALKPNGGVYVGPLPNDLTVANTSEDWSGTHWTVIKWPLPLDTPARDRLMAHELFHRLQGTLHLLAEDAQNPHLDTREGRIWLQLEWRALARALVSSGAVQTEAVRDAAAFRRRRLELFTGSAETERRLNIQEGLPEYTGVALGSIDHASGVWRTVGMLSSPNSQTTFVRLFSYTSGPAYGLLLDERAPGWRTRLTASSDLGSLLETTAPLPENDRWRTRAAMYGEADLRTSETERQQLADAQKAKFRALLVEGPTLNLPKGSRFQYGFNPNELVPLGDSGTVYPTLQASDDWGSVEVSEGALIAPDRLVLPAPKTLESGGGPISGPGWKLTLAPGWKLSPGPCAGCYQVTPPR